MCQKITCKASTWIFAACSLGEAVIVPRYCLPVHGQIWEIPQIHTTFLHKFCVEMMAKPNFNLFNFPHPTSPDPQKFIAGTSSTVSWKSLTKSDSPLISFIPLIKKWEFHPYTSMKQKKNAIKRQQQHWLIIYILHKTLNMKTLLCNK